MYWNILIFFWRVLDLQIQEEPGGIGTRVWMFGKICSRRFSRISPQIAQLFPWFACIELLWTAHPSSGVVAAQWGSIAMAEHLCCGDRWGVCLVATLGSFAAQGLSAAEGANSAGRQLVATPKWSGGGVFLSFLVPKCSPSWARKVWSSSWTSSFQSTMPGSDLWSATLAHDAWYGFHIGGVELAILLWTWGLSTFRTWRLGRLQAWDWNPRAAQVAPAGALFCRAGGKRPESAIAVTQSSLYRAVGVTEKKCVCPHPGLFSAIHMNAEWF